MENLIVKDNALIEASHKLGEVEQRLILLAILKARKHCNKVEQLQGKELIIHADDYAATFAINRQMSYKALRKAVMSLFEAKWGYKYINTKGNKVVRYERFTQSAEYIDGEGLVKFKFADAIIPMLVELERRFTTYEIEQVAHLSSGYAMRLYEFFMQHLDKKTGNGWLEISLDDLRFRFGLLPTEYNRMCDFKNRVLDHSIKQINENTDLSANYTQKKTGRTITGFKFEFKKDENQPETAEPIRDTRVIDMFTGLTDEEHAIINARVDDYISALEHKGETVTDFHRQNITQKAINEQWGIADYRAEQEKKQAKKREHEKRLADEKAKLERQEQERQLREQRKNTMIAKFESLTSEQQNLILDEVGRRIGNVFAKIFKSNREANTAHKNSIFTKHFFELLDC